MTEAEAVAAIGLPPGDYRFDRTGLRNSPNCVRGEGYHVLEWEADGCYFHVWVNERTGRINGIVLGEPWPPPTFSQRARTWLGL
ncbi:MAG TPA: hypothetical protein VFW33_17230 [Gemmataceae bacterium]|nr:hypothetical protein [Gemmataceae bacterium]